MTQEAFVNPDLLVWARETINMTVEDAAAKIGVSVDRLMEWEAGERRPTIRQAREMARVYRRPLSAFFLPKRPEKLGFRVPHDYRRLPDSERKPSPELIAELRRIEYLREAALNLAEVIPTNPADFIGSVTPSDPVDTVAYKASDLLHVTESDRATWRDHYAALNAWKNAVENLGVLVFHIEHVDVGEVRGIAIADRQFPIIAVNGSDTVYGRIFSLVHEFVHLMLGTSGMSDLREARSVVTQDERVEAFCNAVAAEVLVPHDLLLRHPAIRGIPANDDWSDDTLASASRSFRVSREVIARRLVTLGMASLAFYRRKRQQYGEEAKPQEGGFMKQSVKALRAVGKPFARIALDAYDREAISGSQLAEYLGVRLKHLAEIERALEGRNILTGGDR